MQWVQLAYNILKIARIFFGYLIINESKRKRTIIQEKKNSPLLFTME